MPGKQPWGNKIRLFGYASSVLLPTLTLTALPLREDSSTPVFALSDQKVLELGVPPDNVKVEKVEQDFLVHVLR